MIATKHWAMDYLGKPWEAGACGPKSFDCWGLLTDIYKNQLDKTLTRYPEIDRNDKPSIAAQVYDEIRSGWDIVETPFNLCAVGLSNLPSRIYHVGCYIVLNDKGYVLHTRKNFGCMIEPLHKVILNWKHISFYGLR
jgi:hypothetical protein